MPNPASVFCIEKAKGKLEVIDGQNGQIGICVFSDKGFIEEWTLYRAKKLGKKQRAVEEFKTSSGSVPQVMPRPGHPLPSPAKIRCQGEGGQYISYTRENGDFAKLCEFTDGSAVGASTLMYGPKKDGGKELMKVLKMNLANDAQ